MEKKMKDLRISKGWTDEEAVIAGKKRR